MTTIAGLDIGTTKVCCLVVQAQPGQTPQVVGVGVSPCRGLRQGQVVDMEQTVQAIEKAVQEAQAMSDITVHEVFVGVTGAHIETIPRQAEIAITRPDHEVTEEDLERLRAFIQQVHLPPDRELLHVLLRQYTLDGQSGILNPLGMSASHIRAEGVLITGGLTFLQNIRRCVERAELRVKGLVLEPLASGLAVLTPQEREVGVALIDIGGGTTDVAIFAEGDLVYTGVAPLGGMNVTRDIYLMFRLSSMEEAENLKREHGCALAERVPEAEVVTYREMGTHQERRVPRRLLTEVIEERMREILELAQGEIERSGLYDRLTGGIVLTGGGACLPCMAELGRQVLGPLPVRVGTPQSHLLGLSPTHQHPAFSTAVGLALYGYECLDSYEQPTMFSKLWERFVRRFTALFKRKR